MPLSLNPLTLGQFNELHGSKIFKVLVDKYYTDDQAYAEYINIHIRPEDIKEIRELIASILKKDIKSAISSPNPNQTLNFAFKTLENEFIQLAIYYTEALTYTKSSAELRKSLDDLKKTPKSKLQNLKASYERVIKKLEAITKNKDSATIESLSAELQKLSFTHKQDCMINLNYCLAKNRAEKIEEAIVKLLNREVTEILGKLYINKPNILDSTASPPASSITHSEKRTISGEICKVLNETEEMIINYHDHNIRSGKALSDLQQVYLKAAALWYRLNFSGIQEPTVPYQANDETVELQLINIRRRYFQPAYDHAILLMEHQVFAGDSDALYKKIEKKFMQLLDLYACAVCEVIVCSSPQDYEYIGTYLKFKQTNTTLSELIGEYKDRKPTYLQGINKETKAHAINTNPLTFIKDIHSILHGFILLIDPKKVKSDMDYNNFADLTQHLEGTKKYLDMIPKDFIFGSPKTYKP